MFEIYIKTTPERLWEALTDPNIRAKYNFDASIESDWTPGSHYVAGSPRASELLWEGENLEVDPPRRLVQSFNALWGEDVKREGANARLYGGWMMILSGLKTLLETGELLTAPGSLRYTQATQPEA